MELNKIKQRLELALKPAKPPTPGEVLEEVSTHGVLRGPVDWVFPAWMLYVEYATQRIIETFQLTEEEKRRLFHFRDAMKRLLLEAWMQAKEKLAALYKAVVEGTYRVEGNRLYAPDGTWMYVRGYSASLMLRIPIHGVTAKTRFPDLLKLPRERLELLQLGWRASDESEMVGRPAIGTTQPWQMFAWTAVRYGELYAYVASVNLTREGVSISVYLRSNSWTQKWDKDDAVDLVVNRFRCGEWAPLLTMWLGDGQAERRKVLSSEYKLMIANKEPRRLGISVGVCKALIASGKEAFAKLKETAGVYGKLLDLLKAHKWIYIKLATDDVLRSAHKLKTEKRNIDRLREAYGENSYEISTVSHAEANKPGAVAVAGVVMYLELVGGRGGSLVAKYFTRDLRNALAAADKLKAAGLRPNIVRSNANYVVYIATADLLKLAEKDDAVRRAIALYLAEKVKNGTPRQREIAEKILKRHPLFSTDAFLHP
jgi:hypothetical protein